MRAAGLGGRPGGLYCGISLKRRDPAHEDVVERDRPGDSFGWGVALSDETLDNMRPNDAEPIGGSFAYWDDIAVYLPCSPSAGAVDGQAIAFVGGPR